MGAHGMNAKRMTADERDRGHRTRGAKASAARRRSSGTRDSSARRGLARMGEREIVALLAPVEEQIGDEFTESTREEIIDPGFDDMPSMWEALGIPDANVRLRSSPLAMLNDGGDADW